jgi:hypothetical protein
MRPRPEYIERFSVDRAGNLVRSVVPKRGKPYEHKCRKESFEEVAYTADEMAAEGTPIKLEPLAARTGLPSTQVAVALAFLLERGCLVTENRMHYPAGGNQKPGQVSLDAITEYHALAEGSPGSKQPDLPEGAFDDANGEEA